MGRGKACARRRAGRVMAGGLMLCALLADAAVVRADAIGPAVNLWYGPEQTSGSPGVAQRWVNVLGNVSDPDGVNTLTFSLNGGPAQTLSVGPDTRRLLKPGDFNIEIDFIDLVTGSNGIVITATDNVLNTSITEVSLDYAAGNVWPLPVSLDLSGTSGIQQVAQIVDGEWIIASNGLRCPVMGYDRVLAVGDLVWTDYEVTATITMLELDPAGFAWPSVSPGFGITLRWPGHSDDPVVCAQPHCGWLPSGGSIWYNAGGDGPLRLNGDLGLLEEQNRTLAYDVPYVFKIRAQTVPGQGTFYATKVWEAASAEPAPWDLSGFEPVGDELGGSAIFIAHHVDIFVEDVSVVALTDTDPPVISNIQITPADVSAMVTWTTDEPATSRVDFGTTTAYGNTSSNGALVTAHSIILVGLDPETLYHCRITSTDVDTNAASSADQQFSTLATPSTVLVSDQFNQPALDTNAWTFVDPLSDSNVTMTGTQVSINIPVTANDHEIWINGNTAPRIIQAAPDSDFEFVVKFDSSLTQELQIQGVAVEHDADNVVRAEFHRLSGSTRIYVASIFGGVADVHIHQPVTLIAPMYMKLRREGDAFTVSRSQDGVNYTAAANFNQPMTVTAVGIHAGAPAGGAHSALADYFLDTSEPPPPDCNSNGVDDAQDISAATSADCNASGVPDECELAGNDCNTNAVPDECETDCNSNGTPDACEAFTDCNATGVPDECELAGNDCDTNAVPDECDADCNTNGTPDDCELHADCNTNGSPDACDILAGTSVDANADTVPDECQVRNLTQQTVHASITDAIAAALGGDALLAPAAQFDAEPLIDFSGKDLHLESTAAITQPGDGALTLADGTHLAAAPAAAITINGVLGSGAFDDAQLSAAEVIISSTGSLTVPVSAGLDVSAPGGMRVGGAAEVQPQATLAVSDGLTVSGNLSLLGGVLAAAPLSINTGGLVSGYGNVTGDTLNDGDVVIIADTQIIGDYTNDGTTTIQGGTLTLTGSLTGSGTIVGAPAAIRSRNALPRASGDGMLVAGDFRAGVSATLRLPGAKWDLRVGGDFDAAIDDYTAFDMSTAELRMVGLGIQEQALEVLSADIGPDVAALSPTAPGRFPIGTLRIGPTATTVRLVDLHDNTGGGEAVYADHLAIDAGAQLITDGHLIYYRTLDLAGSVDGPENLIPLQGPPGDCDVDGDVDAADLAGMVDCLSGPGVPPPATAGAGCSCLLVFDLDTDGDVDLRDVALLRPVP